VATLVIRSCLSQCKWRHYRHISAVAQQALSCLPHTHVTKLLEAICESLHRLQVESWKVLFCYYCFSCSRKSFFRI